MNKHTLPRLFVLSCVVWVLAACAGEPAPTPTATPDAPTQPSPADTTPEATLPLPTEDPVALLIPTVDLQITIYPTFIPEVFPTNDPSIILPTEEVVPPPSGFDQIVVVRTGGSAFTDGQTPPVETITIRRDGTVMRGTSTGTTAQQTLDELASLIDSFQFFTVDAIFLGPIPLDAPTPFFYGVTVTSGDVDRTINAQDGFMPPELRRLVGMVMNEGLRLPQP